MEEKAKSEIFIAQFKYKQRFPNIYKNSNNLVFKKSVETSFKKYKNVKIREFKSKTIMNLLNLVLQTPCYGSKITFSTFGHRVYLDIKPCSLA